MFDVVVEALVGTGEEREIFDRIKSAMAKGDVVPLSFRDDRTRDLFAKRFIELGFKKNSDFFVDSERIDLRARSVRDAPHSEQLVSSLARALVRHESGIGIDPSTPGPERGFRRSPKMSEVFSAQQRPAGPELEKQARKERGEHPWMTQDQARRVASDHMSKSEAAPPGREYPHAFKQVQRAGGKFRVVDVDASSGRNVSKGHREFNDIGAALKDAGAEGDVAELVSSVFERPEDSSFDPGKEGVNVYQGMGNDKYDSIDIDDLAR